MAHARAVQRAVAAFLWHVAPCWSAAAHACLTLDKPPLSVCAPHTEAKRMYMYEHFA